MLTYEHASNAMEKPSIVGSWDFNTSLGNSVSERFEWFLSQAMLISNSLIRHGAKGYFWMVVSPETYTMIQLLCERPQLRKDKDQIPLGIKEFEFKGILSNHFALYISQRIIINQVYIGCGHAGEESYFARMNIVNYYHV